MFLSSSLHEFEEKMGFSECVSDEESLGRRGDDVGFPSHQDGFG